MWVRFNYDGKFTKTSYEGGKDHVVREPVDEDRFGFCDLAESIKDTLGFKEIGGIYAKGRPGESEWKLLQDDGDVQTHVWRCKTKGMIDFYIDTVVDRSIPKPIQFQPHIDIIPRKNIYQATTMNAKRKLVTLQTVINQEKTKLVAKKKRQMEQELGPTDRSVIGEHSVPYEQLRDMNIASNQQRLAALNLPNLAASLNVQGKSDNKDKVQSEEGSEEYLPTNDIPCEDSSEDPDEVVPKKAKQGGKKQVQGRHTTRANDGATAKTAKNVAADKKILPSSPARNTRLQKRKAVEAGQTSEVQIENANVTEESNLISAKDNDGKIRRQRIRFDGPGCMGDLQASEGGQQNEDGNCQSDSANPEKSTGLCTSTIRKKRGKTMMAKVHARKLEDRKEIPLNARFQPASSDTNLVSEFSLFLGTLARECVPLTYNDWRKVPDKDHLWEFTKEKYIIAEEGKPWVLKTIGQNWKLYKSRVKLKHYNKYDNDADRIKNRPPHIPLDEFKMLLTYWGSEKVKAIAAHNAANRRQNTEPHTAGPRSYAQLSLKMAEENGEEPSKAQLYVATRKRKDGRDYKTPAELINYKIATIEQMCTNGTNSDTVDQVVSGDSSHWSSWLVGRRALPKKKKMNTSQSTSEGIDVKALTSQIEENLKLQLEETVNQKVKENMTILVKQLSEAYPHISINMKDACDGSSDNVDNNA